jgi:hypothetical protein
MDSLSISQLLLHSKRVTLAWGIQGFTLCILDVSASFSVLLVTCQLKPNFFWVHLMQLSERKTWIHYVWLLQKDHELMRLCYETWSKLLVLGDCLWHWAFATEARGWRIDPGLSQFHLIKMCLGLGTPLRGRLATVMIRKRCTTSEGDHGRWE